MKKIIYILSIILFILNFSSAQTISGELYGGGLYGSNGSADLAVTLTASSQYPSGSASSPTIFVLKVLQTEWDAAGITSVTVYDNPLQMGSGGAPDGEWNDGSGYHYLYYSAGVADWDLNTCPTALGSGSTYLSLKFEGMTSPMTVELTLKGTDLVVGSEVNLVNTNQLTSVNSLLIGTTLALQNANLNVDKLNSNSTLLTWDVIDNINVSSYEVLKSRPNGRWEKIGEVSASEYRGFDLKYQFIDENAYDGKGIEHLYYKIRLINHDGIYFYSNIEYVMFLNENDSDKLVIYPNPTLGEVNFTLNKIKAGDPIDISVFDLGGSLIYQTETHYNAGKNRLIELDNYDLRGGVYHLIVQDKLGSKHYAKFIIQK